MNQENLTQFLTKDYHLCYPCEFFDGHVDIDGNLTNFEFPCRCLEGNNPCKCGIARDLAKHIIHCLLQDLINISK